jgi:hypothetical protein
MNNTNMTLFKLKKKTESIINHRKEYMEVFGIITTDYIYKCVSKKGSELGQGNLLNGYKTLPL